ncbi:DUF4189 domain-containing protein [Roseococcus sp. SDR]|uniref:DUF4189 domain-containing protein n=1 Tax=Roseococcus sp. SDR TaxID=2835532 RepID=UPI001BCE6202|nr:DUF4189 domain-containing protein [Roseococcus sp. SDR]MBS7792890.1 DUF4189 domain-containing protein [Roseococcus sp. SDR]MBV1848204.1 DUF4189 domain-containing protein [Roseococcus sp. SDR]
MALLLGAAAQAQTGNPTHDALQARSDTERRQALHEAVRSRGDQCNSVILAFHAGMDGQRNAFWDFRCADGAQYRARLPSERFAAIAFLRCGAAAPTPHHGGPCFQAVTGAAAQVAAAGGGNEASCRAACASQPAAGQNQCVQRCLSGQGIEVGQQAAATLPPGTRFGAMYVTDQPVAAYGFANGNTDRLAVNMAAVRICQTLAGQVPCKFQGELVNQCGAIAMAISRHPRAMVMTSDLSTQVLNLATTGRGANRQAAEAEALQACRRAEGPGVQCRIVAGGC